MNDGYVMFEGLSMLDGTPIVVVATMNSNNGKTGNMIQTWIMRSDIEPHIAVREGVDTVCGTCPLRSGKGCYVTIHQAPLSVWRSWKRGNYPVLDTVKRFTGRKLRIGAYGCPTNAPISMWQSAVRYVLGWTGYTHEWRSCDQDYRHLLMASTHSVDELRAAEAAGWRSFRAKRATDEVDAREFYCPSDRGIACEQCNACNGTAQATRSASYRSVAITVHGSSHTVKRAELTISR